MIQIPEDNQILFYARDRQNFGFLSHFHPSPIVVDDENWPTVEHFYQAQKSPIMAYRNAIRAVEHPGHVKRLSVSPVGKARLIKGSWFAKNGKVPRADWQDVKVDLMRLGDQAKYTQNPELAALLLATGDAELIEEAENDAFWGTGKNGIGLNWAGRILMEIRESLRNGMI
jgi:N-glycosidase YbiA